MLQEGCFVLPGLPVGVFGLKGHTAHNTHQWRPTLQHHTHISILWQEISSPQSNSKPSTPNTPNTHTHNPFKRQVKERGSTCQAFTVTGQGQRSKVKGPLCLPGSEQETFQSSPTPPAPFEWTWAETLGTHSNQGYHDDGYPSPHMSTHHQHLHRHKHFSVCTIQSGASTHIVPL